MADSPAQVVPQLKPAWWIPSVFGMTVGLILFITTFFIFIKADDIWWHLKAGEYIVSNMQIPDQNLFSFTAPEHSWLPQEWASQVVFYLIHRLLGPLGLILFGIMLNAVACALVYKLTVRYSGSPYISALITMLAGLMMLGNFSLRPYLFGNLFFICALHAMEEPTAGGKLRPVLLFLLFSAWANFHGSFIIGLALIIIYLAAALASHLRGPKRSFSDARSYLVDFSVGLVACVFTPNHVFGLIFPFTYLQNAFSGKTTFLTNISEWQAAGFSSPLGNMIGFYLLFCVFAIVGSSLLPSAVHFGLLVAFAFFAYTTIRNIPLLGIAATPILARHLPRTLSKTWRLSTKGTPFSNGLDRLHLAAKSVDKRAQALVPIGLWLLFISLICAVPSSSPISYRSLTSADRLEDLTPSFYPRGLLNHLKENGAHRRIFNYFNWGGAFVYALYPQVPVFIDQRNDCYPQEVFLDYFWVHNQDHNWEQVLDRWRIDSVAYPVDSDLARALRGKPGWTEEYEDEQSVLFSRAAIALQ